MSELYSNGDAISNPYMIAPAQPMGINEQHNHDSGNALAANSEARAIAEVKAQVLMARQFPRDPAYATDRILKECMRPTLAEAAVYTFSRGKETVSGPSIRLAEVLARNWGNCTFGYEVLERKKNSMGIGISVVRAYAWDLETNTYISRQFELKHFRDTRSGGYELTQDRDIYELESNMASRRMRACILQMIPGDITSAAVNACRKTESTGISARMKNPDERKRLVSETIRLYAKLGVEQKDLEDKMRTNVENWNADVMLKLKEMYNAIKDNVTGIEEFFPHLAANERDSVVTKEQAKALMEAAARTGKQGAISDIMKQMGIAKFADTPATRYEELMNVIAGFGNAEQRKTAAAIPASTAVEQMEIDAKETQKTE